MALTYADLFGPLIDVVDIDVDAKAGVTTARTAQYAWPSSGSAVSTPEFKELEDASQTFYGSAIDGNGGIQNTAVDTILTYWIPFAARYIRDNETGAESVTATIDSVAAALLRYMLDDSQTVDASVPSVGAVVYGTANQGDGTATVAVNSDSTLAELPLAGSVICECVVANFDNQNEELWQLRWVGDDPRTGEEITRYSASPNFKTATRYFDVIASLYPGVGLSPSARDQIPQRGGAIHTGLNILISVPAYNTAAEASGDVDLVGSAYDPRKKIGTKSNLTKRNVTYVWSNANENATIYLRIAKDGANYNCTWYQDSALTVALTNTITLTVASGNIEQVWTAAATNPEVFLDGGFLSEGDNFIGAVINAALLTQSATIVVSFNLPWAQGDHFSVPVTNAYGGLIERFAVQELGIALPANSAGGETIADPA